MRFAFERIRAVAARIRRKRGASELRIDALPTFGLRFLIPRLPRFQAAHPDIRVDITAHAQAAAGLLSSLRAGAARRPDHSEFSSLAAKRNAARSDGWRRRRGLSAFGVCDAVHFELGS